MKSFIASILLGLMAATIPQQALALGRVDTEALIDGVNRASMGAFPRYLAGKVVADDTVHSMRCVYDFTVVGGAVSTINLLSTQGDNGKLLNKSAAVLPKGAVVTNVWIDVITQPVGSGASVAFSTGKAAGDLLAAALATTMTVGLHAGIPVGTPATSIKLTADSKPTIAISGGALTVGKVALLIEYRLSETL